jgi:hydrogenase nickel incorporation protein HypB
MSPQLESRFDLNSRIARANRASFDAAGITAISLVGPAGAGKTTLIEATLARLDPKLRAAVIVGGLAAERQVERIARHGCRAVSLVTDNLAAINVREALGQMDLGGLDILFIESEGNAHSPVEFDLGHHLRASVFSVAGGDDKATEYPFLIAGSDVVLLTKMDMLPVLAFDFSVFSQDVVRVKPKMPIIQVSVQSNLGIAQCVEWVESHVSPTLRDRPASRPVDPFIRIPKP